MGIGKHVASPSDDHNDAREFVPCPLSAALESLGDSASYNKASMSDCYTRFVKVNRRKFETLRGFALQAP